MVSVMKKDSGEGYMLCWVRKGLQKKLAVEATWRKGEGESGRGDNSGINANALKQERLLVPWRLHWAQWLDEGEEEEPPRWVEKGKDRKGSVEIV